MKNRTLCVVTGSRAEFGLLSVLLGEVTNDPEIRLQLVVSGMHLSPEFGMTVRAIEADGWSIDARVEMLLAGDSGVAIAKSVGVGTIGFADAFSRLRPDLIVLLGDRFEILAAATAALFARIPVAHIHGGEVTEGALDEGIRHAITKLSHLHFVAAEAYQKRVIQLGEHPDRVHLVGAPGLDVIMRLPALSRADLERRLGFRFRERNFLVTVHPATQSEGSSSEALIDATLAALDQFPESGIIITKPNADNDSRPIIARLEAYAQKNADRVHLSASLGQQGYLSAVRYVDVVVGNSSSGVIEAPALKQATVNIGDRQSGRLKAASVIDCEVGAKAIERAVAKALTPEFRAGLSKVTSLYGGGDASRRIKETLKSVPLEGLTRKGFYDLST